MALLLLQENWMIWQITLLTATGDEAMELRNAGIENRSSFLDIQMNRNMMMPLFMI